MKRAGYLVPAGIVVSAIGIGCGARPAGSNPAETPTVATPEEESPSAAVEPAPPSEESDPSPIASTTGDGTWDPLVGLDGIEYQTEVGPLALLALSGPYQSVEAYARSLSAEVEEGCQAQSEKVSVAPKTLPGKGAVEEARLTRFPTGDSCNPEETCVIALKSDDVWFATSRLCLGFTKDGRSVQVSDTTLSWVEIGKTPAIQVEYTVATGRGNDRLELRWQRYCALSSATSGSAGAHCTRPFVSWCREGGGPRQSVQVQRSEDVLVLSSSHEPGRACAGEEGFVTGSFPLKF